MLFRSIGALRTIDARRKLRLPDVRRIFGLALDGGLRKLLGRKGDAGTADHEANAERIQDDQHLVELHGGLAILELDKEAAADAEGKSRVINVPDDRKEFWKENIGILRNPVIRKFVLREDIKLEKKAGISALCEYSLLSDNAYPTYAVTKKKLKASGVKMEKQASVSEDIGCVVLELGYFIDFFGKGLQDPLSVALSLTREEQEERVKISVNEMLEEYVWSKD